MADDRLVPIRGEYAEILDSFEEELHAKFPDVRLSISVNVQKNGEALIDWLLWMPEDDALQRNVCRWTDDWREVRGLEKRLQHYYE